MAMPTSAAASAGASLMPSPTMMVGCSRCSARTASTLSEGTRSARTASRSSAAPMVCAAAARSPVTMTIRMMPAARSMRMACGVSLRSSSASSSAPIGRPSTATNTTSAERQEARRMARAAHCSGRRPAKIMSREPALTRLPAIMPCRPEPMASLTCAGICSGRPRASAAATMAPARTCCEACSSEAPSRSTSSALVARRRLDREQAGAADGQGSGLVEQDGVGARQLLQRPAAFDQDAAPGRPGDAGDEGDRRRQDERAGRGRDQHREAAHQIAGEEPGGAGHRERQRQEQERIAIGEPHERRLGGLRRRHQPHDARIGAFAGDRRRRHLEGLAGIQRAAEELRALRLDHRDRLAGQRRLVDHGAVAADHAVDRNDLAGAHQHPVADRDVADRHVLDARAGQPMRQARRPVDQRAQVVLGAQRPRRPPARCRRNTSAPPRRRRAARRAPARPSSIRARSHRRRNARPAGRAR